LSFLSGSNFIQEFIAKKSDDFNQAVFGVQNRASNSAGGQLTGSIQDRVSQPAFDHISQNPIIAMGEDTANQAITTISQQLLVTGSKKLEAAVNKATGINIRKTIQDVTDGYFTIVGLVSTASVEIAMELARTNARSIVSLIGKKEEAIKTIQTEIRALNNAVVILSNADPFFKDYYAKLVQAYTNTLAANTQLKSVSRILSTTHRYNSIVYEKSLNQLIAARDVILPDRDVDVTSIRGITDFLEQTITRQTNKQALAAALSIPGITAKIGAAYLSYVEYTVGINVLIALFLTVLDDFINTYKRNDNLDQNTINHIKAGTVQLDSLLADMRVVLFPKDSRASATFTTPVVNLNVPKYASQVTTSATGWGIRLTTIIEWLKVQPGRASKELDVTSESVLRYQAAVKLLKAQGNIPLGGATLNVKESQENVKETTFAVGKLLFLANTTIGTQQTPAELLQRRVQLVSLFNAATILDTRIKTALQPFIDTPFNLLNGADKVVKQMGAISRDLGLDRAADLLEKADIKGFYAMSGTTATYAGAAVAGMTAIIGSMKSDPATTDSELASMENVKSGFDRDNEAKKVEATRSASSSSEQFVAEQKQGLDASKQQASAADEVAQKKDAAVAASPINTAQNTITKAIGNKMNFGGF
jgi:hypothetical protein